MTTTITPELIRAALAHIPATLQRDDWARVGMAIQSEFPDDTGLGLFTDWSATAEGFNVGEVRSTWRRVERLNLKLLRAFSGSDSGHSSSIKLSVPSGRSQA